MRLSRIIGLQKHIMRQIHWCLKTEKENPIYFLKWCRINCFSWCKMLFLILLFFLNVTISVAPSAVCCWKHPEECLVKHSFLLKIGMGETCVRLDLWIWLRTVKKDFLYCRTGGKKLQNNGDPTAIQPWWGMVFSDTTGTGERGGRGEGEDSTGGCSGCSSCGGHANTVTSLSQETQVAPTRETGWDNPWEGSGLQCLQVCRIDNRIIFYIVKIDQNIFHWS